MSSLLYIVPYAGGERRKTLLNVDVIKASVFPAPPWSSHSVILRLAAVMYCTYDIVIECNGDYFPFFFALREDENGRRIRRSARMGPSVRVKCKRDGLSRKRRRRRRRRRIREGRGDIHQLESCVLEFSWAFSFVSSPKLSLILSSSFLFILCVRR